MRPPFHILLETDLSPVPEVHTFVTFREALLAQVPMVPRARTITVLDDDGEAVEMQWMDDEGELHSWTSRDAMEWWATNLPSRFADWFSTTIVHDERPGASL